jgi:hypothetical protein
MKKKEITYTGLVKIMMAKARKESTSSGKPFDTKTAFSSAAARWKHVKDGSDAEFSQGKTVPGMKRTSKKSKGVKKNKTCDNAHIKLNNDILNKVDVCEDCKIKIKKFLASSGKRTRKTKFVT